MKWRRRSVLALGAGLAAGLARAADLPAATPIALTMATGEPGGGFALYGPEWGQRVTNGENVSISYRVSGGSAANILLVEQGAVQLGLTTLAVADQAWLGDGAWTEQTKLQNFRALFPIFETTWQIITPLGSAIRQLNDLAGRRIGVGPAGGGSAVLTAPLLQAAGIAPHLTITELYAQQIELLHRREIDACAFLGPTPLPVIRQNAAESAFNLIGVTAVQQNAMRRAVPGVTAAVIPRVSLPRQSAAVASVGTGAIAIGRADLPDTLVSALVEAALATPLIGPGVITPKATWIGDGNPIAIHPGAAHVLRRHGFAAPARLVRR